MTSTACWCAPCWARRTRAWTRRRFTGSRGSPNGHAELSTKRAAKIFSQFSELGCTDLVGVLVTLGQSACGLADASEVREARIHHLFTACHLDQRHRPIEAPTREVHFASAPFCSGAFRSSRPTEVLCVRHHIEESRTQLRHRLRDLKQDVALNLPLPSPVPVFKGDLLLNVFGRFCDLFHLRDDLPHVLLGRKVLALFAQVRFQESVDERAEQHRQNHTDHRVEPRKCHHVIRTCPCYREGNP